MIEIMKATDIYNMDRGDTGDKPHQTDADKPHKTDTDDTIHTPPNPHRPYRRQMIDTTQPT